MTNTQPFADAQAALPFVIEQGRNIETKVYEKRYPSIAYGNIVPVVTEGADWAIGTLFFKLDTTGQAKIISGAANDMPFNQTTREQATRDFTMIGSGWEWNMEEVNQAALYNIPLNDSKAMGASRSVEQLLYDFATIGSTEKNWTGFVNDATVPRVDAANTGTGPSRHWDTKTVDQIMTDVNVNFGAIRTNTLEVEWADTIALPPNQFRDIATRRLGSGDGNMTLLEYLRKNNVYTAETGLPVNIISVRALATASSLGGGRMVIYRRDNDVLRFHLPMPKRQLDVHQKSIMGFETGLIARTGGLEIRLPKAMIYVDEIA